MSTMWKDGKGDNRYAKGEVKEKMKLGDLKIETRAVDPNSTEHVFNHLILYSDGRLLGTTSEFELSSEQTKFLNNLQQLLWHYTNMSPGTLFIHPLKGATVIAAVYQYKTHPFSKPYLYTHIFFVDLLKVKGNFIPILERIYQKGIIVDETHSYYTIADLVLENRPPITLPRCIIKQSHFASLPEGDFEFYKENISNISKIFFGLFNSEPTQIVSNVPDKVLKLLAEIFSVIHPLFNQSFSPSLITQAVFNRCSPIDTRIDIAIIRTKRSVTNLFSSDSKQFDVKFVNSHKYEKNYFPYETFIKKLFLSDSNDRQKCLSLISGLALHTHIHNGFLQLVCHIFLLNSPIATERYNGLITLFNNQFHEEIDKFLLEETGKGMPHLLEIINIFVDSNLFSHLKWILARVGEHAIATNNITSYFRILNRVCQHLSQKNEYAKKEVLGGIGDLVGKQLTLEKYFHELLGRNFSFSEILSFATEYPYAFLTFKQTIEKSLAESLKANFYSISKKFQVPNQEKLRGREKNATTNE